MKANYYATQQKVLLRKVNAFLHALIVFLIERELLPLYCIK